MKTPYGETIRGEVSIFRGGAGGLSYFSRCSAKGILCTGANWAEAVAMAVSKNRQLMLEVVEDLICGVYRFG